MGLEGNKTPRFSFHSSALTITRYSNKTKKLAVTLASFCYSKSAHLAVHYTTIMLFFITVVPGRICNSNNSGCDIQSNASISSNFFRQSNTISTVNSWLITESIIFICTNSIESNQRRQLRLQLELVLVEVVRSWFCFC